MKNKKLVIWGASIQLLAISVMFYGIIYNQSITWIGFPFVFIGLFIIVIAIIKGKNNN